MSNEKVTIRCERWKSVKVTAPTGGLVAGQLYQVGYLIGMIVNDADVGEEAVMIYSAEKIVVAKTAGSGIAFAVGDKVYYDESENEVTTHSTGNTLCGRATEISAATDTTAEIDLHGDIIA